MTLRSKPIISGCLFLAVLSVKAQVGIGTQTPSSALDLEEANTTEVDLGINNTSTGDPVFHFQLSGTTTFSLGVDNSDADKLKMGTTDVGTSTFVTIDSNGDLGVGDDDPAYKVEVNGDANLSNSTDVLRIGAAHALSKPNTKNIYVGRSAGAQNNAAGTDNSYLGYQAGYSSTSGDYNVAVGNEASYTNTGGIGNVALGYQAGYSSAATHYSVRIGSQSGYGSVEGNSLYLDNSSTSNPLIYGDFSQDDLTVNGGLVVNEQSGTFDFRVESDNKTHILYTDATNDYVMIGSNNNVTNRQIQVNSTGASAGMLLARHSDDADGSVLGHAKSRGSEGTPSVVVDDDVISPIKFVGYDGIDFNHTSATIEAKVNGTPGSNDMPTELRFQTVPDGSNTQQIRMVIEEDGAVGINQTSPTTRLRVDDASAVVGTFNRTTDDGTIIDLQYNGVSEGNISVSGSTVSYNPFTGGHYGYSEKSFEYGKVVILNGENKNLHGNKKSEIFYGIDYSQTPNDKRVLGVYSNLLESEKPFSLDNPHQVLALGNGFMWVTNEGGNIKIGDYLITSSTQGMAMKENGDYPVSYVCARSAQKVNWHKIKADENGVKKALVHVLYESFEVENGVRASINNIEKEIKELKKLVAQKYQM